MVKSVCNRGAFPRPIFGVALMGFPIIEEHIAAAGKAIGLPVRMVVFYLQWPEAPFLPCTEQLIALAASLRAIHAAGAMPCLTWEPMCIGGNGMEYAIPANVILDGAYDGYLAACARIMKASGSPVLVRLGHEMNLERYHWGGPSEVYGPESPARYRKIFRHVAKVIHDQDASNIRLVFCPNAESVPDEPWNTPAAYYPGDDVVDLLGMDGYDWSTSQIQAEHGYDSQSRSFAVVFRPLYEALRRLAPDKTILVLETASAGDDKLNWALHALETAREWGLYAIVWFQADKEQSWAIRHSVKSTSRLRLLVSDRLYEPAGSQP